MGRKWRQNTGKEETRSKEIVTVGTLRDALSAMSWRTMLIKGTNISFLSEVFISLTLRTWLFKKFSSTSKERFEFLCQEVVNLFPSEIHVSILLLPSLLLFFLLTLNFMHERHSLFHFYVGYLVWEVHRCQNWKSGCNRQTYLEVL